MKKKRYSRTISDECWCQEKKKKKSIKEKDKTGGKKKKRSLGFMSSFIK